MSYGLEVRHIYQLGEGAECLDTCLRSFRGRPGCLVVAQDLRVFGPTKKEVSERAGALEQAEIRIIDISHPDDTTYAALVHTAHVKISGSRFQNKRAAKRMGRFGGQCKGIAEQNRRDAVAPAWLVDKIVNHPDLTWRIRMDLLAPHFSEATLRRHYGITASLKRVGG